MDAADFASRLLYAAAWCAGRLPLRWQQAIGARLGDVMRWRDAREARVARRNIALVAPGLAPAAAAALHRDVLRQTGRLGMETLRIWTRPRADNLALVAAVHGEAHLQAARDAGRGVIVAAPHYGNHELVIEWMAARGPFALVYRAPEEAYGDRFLRLARAGENVVLVQAEAAAMRPLLKALHAGGAVGITPDQQPKEGAGEFAPFFGRPAQTLTLVPRDGAGGLCRAARGRSFRRACGARRRGRGRRRPGRRAGGDERRGRTHRAPRHEPVPVDLQTLQPAPARQRRTQSLPAGFPMTDDASSEWRTLPPAARTVAMISGVLLALPAAVAIGFLASTVLDAGTATGIALFAGALLAIAVAGALYGRARWRRTRWRVDARGLQVCRGVVWRTEVLVPRSRVQHLDIERGPIERRFGLATLVVHTAGTRLSALRQSGFLDADAVALRDALLPEAVDGDL